jgi:hypothetical protein
VAVAFHHVCQQYFITGVSSISSGQGDNVGCHHCWPEVSSSSSSSSNTWILTIHQTLIGWLLTGARLKEVVGINAGHAPIPSII